MALRDLLNISFVLNAVKPCRCHFLLTLKSKLMVLINQFIPRCPFYTVCFAFRRTGVHPPLTIS